MALGHFDTVAMQKGWPPPRSAVELDDQLTRFAALIFEERSGRARQTVVCARLACVWLNPALEGQLPRSEAACAKGAWNRTANRTTRRHPPITWPLTLVVAQRLAAVGHAATAMAAVLSFDCALRVSEAAEMRIGDVRDVARVDARLQRQNAPELVVAIRNAKTARDGDVQSAYVLNPAVTAMIREWVALRRAAGAGDDDLLFGPTSAQLGARFTAEAARLRCAATFTWHSLRHGCATFLFMCGWATADVMRQGRWASEASAFHYHQSGRASAAAHGAPDAVLREGERLSAALGSTLPLKPSTAAQEM